MIKQNRFTNFGHSVPNNKRIGKNNEPSILLCNICNVYIEKKMELFSSS